VQFAPFRRHPHDRERDRRVQITENEIGLIAVDQLPRLSLPGADAICRILDEEPRFATENAAGAINLVESELRAGDFSLGEFGVDPGQGFDHSELYRLFAQRAHRQRGGDVHGAKGETTPDHCAACDRP
jgi:hypothetical protein